MTRDELVAVLNSGNYAILTAWKAEARFNVNVENVRKLRSWLTTLGYQTVGCQGLYDGKKEQSLLVPGLDRANAVTFGRGFGQESVLIGGVGLVYCDDSRVVPVDGTLSIDGDETDYFSIALCDDENVQFAIGLDWGE